MKRNRQIYLSIVLLVITLGLFTRSSFMGEGFFKDYAGDTLWAAMVYFGLCFFLPKWSPIKIAIVALCFSYAIEISQLNQEPWLNNIRSTKIGSLVLGRGFLWSDFLCYTTGVLLAYWMDRKLLKGRSSSDQDSYL